MDGPFKDSFYQAKLGFDASKGFHRYTYVVYPNQSWSFYVDGVLQTWVGDKGVAPAETSVDSPMDLILNYALVQNTFTVGSRSFVIDSVAVYQDNAHAGRSMRGGGVAPGTTVAAPVAPVKAAAKK